MYSNILLNCYWLFGDTTQNDVIKYVIYSLTLFGFFEMLKYIHVFSKKKNE